MNISIHESSFDTCTPIFNRVKSELYGVHDSFLEEQIHNSQFYKMQLKSGDEIGYFAICSNEILTEFVVEKPFFRHAQFAFSTMLTKSLVKFALVPTYNESMLSLCMDKQTKVELQAYYFEKSPQIVRAPEYTVDKIRHVPRDQWDNVGEITDNFFQLSLDHPLILARQLYDVYELSENGTILGYGLREGSYRIKNYCSIGNYVLPQHRQKGVGRSLLMNLTQICKDDGLNPLCGCWYFNHNSKRTIESAGGISKTRLFKIWF